MVKNSYFWAVGYSSVLAWVQSAAWHNKNQKQKQKNSLGQWHMPVIPASQEAETGG